MISWEGELWNGKKYAKLAYLLPISGNSGVQKRMAWTEEMGTYFYVMLVSIFLAWMRDLPVNAWLVREYVISRYDHKGFLRNSILLHNFGVNAGFMHDYVFLPLKRDFTRHDSCFCDFRLFPALSKRHLQLSHNHLIHLRRLPDGETHLSMITHKK